MSSADRKGNKGHRPDFQVSCNIQGEKKVEVAFGLFKSPARCSPVYANVDIVDLAVLMKDSLDHYYN